MVLPWAVYRRVRRNIGRQPLSPLRLKLRAGIILAVLALFGGSALSQGLLDSVLALVAGGTIGVLIAVLALRHTKYEQHDGVEYYVPHLYLGLALSSLLLARMAYRVYEVWPQMAHPDGAAPPAFTMPQSPITLALIGLILLYNAAFCIGVLRHHSARTPR